MFWAGFARPKHPTSPFFLRRYHNYLKIAKAGSGGNEATLLDLYFMLVGGGTVLSVRIQSGYTPNHSVTGLGLIYFEALLIMTISMACSSAFSALATGGIVFGLYSLAFIGGWIEQFGAMLQK